MGVNTHIGWTDHSWNVATGCHVVSEGCTFCYMKRDMERYGKDHKTVKKTKGVFTLPLRIKEPSRIFVSSLTDFFIEEIDSYRDEAWEIIRKCPQHTFQILTKRPERIAQCLPDDWGDGYPNVWLGVTAENQKRANERIPRLLTVSAVCHFVSVEPILAPVDLTRIEIQADIFQIGVKEPVGQKAMHFNALEKSTDRLLFNNFVDWVIIGGESGFGKVPKDPKVKWGYRESRLAWYGDIVQQCRLHGTAVFVKQLGTYLAKLFDLPDNSGSDMNAWSEMLEPVKVREFPQIKTLVTHD